MNVHPVYFRPEQQIFNVRPWALQSTAQRRCAAKSIRKIPLIGARRSLIKHRPLEPTHGIRRTYSKFAGWPSRRSIRARAHLRLPVCYRDALASRARTMSPCRVGGRTPPSHSAGPLVCTCGRAADARDRPPMRVAEGYTHDLGLERGATRVYNSPALCSFPPRTRGCRWLPEVFVRNSLKGTWI